MVIWWVWGYDAGLWYATWLRVGEALSFCSPVFEWNVCQAPFLWLDHSVSRAEATDSAVRSVGGGLLSDSLTQRTQAINLKREACEEGFISKALLSYPVLYLHIVQSNNPITIVISGWRRAAAYYTRSKSRHPMLAPDHVMLIQPAAFAGDNLVLAVCLSGCLLIYHRPSWIHKNYKSLWSAAK